MNSHAVTADKEIITNRAANAVIGVVFFILATALGAYVRIPVAGSPVPITLQTFFVVLAGAVLGRRLGIASQLGYLMLGVSGIPVFQGASFGIAHILGPTGGYLAGFVLAAYLVGWLTGFKGSNIYWIIASFIVGNIALYTLGVLWLMILYKINISSAVSIGILPFIPGEALKVFFASVVYSGISERSKRVFSV